ncbi:SAM-dependent DNA methyltransferase [Roseospira marina]|uniref:SAM-dependent DNA methyltransferase n=1 Tax=Roseospira marina TaxID=140057 RepID=A0A5M6I9L5_9PROT|nr:SAM-dependent DNA methyltransferase [Roseospira marina]KAA5604368.1 SAM-dependent DNA methyltransferase [Roseospira marina]MBB4315446.1 hypothetical protein [Roseospira marina]MBB5088408.1 hypothetical protein [Roseospira marina]
MGLGAAMTGGNPKRGRVPNDFYPTPPDVTRALPAVEALPNIIYDPACGDGAMLDVFKALGFKTIGSDIEPRGAMINAKRQDFLTVRGTLPETVAIVTNPPFKFAAEFVRQAHALRCTKLCLVLKGTYWHAARRQALWSLWQPKIVYPLLWRPDFQGLKSPTMEVCWTVWERGYDGPTLYQPINRPKDKKHG